MTRVVSCREGLNHREGADVRSHDNPTDGAGNSATPETTSESDTGRSSDGGPHRVGVANSDRPDVTLLMTYRFLRCGIVAATAAMVVSVLFEIWQTKCLRNAISAYFYSPVRTMFTGGLLAIGLCLIVLQGDGDLEEVSLNFAGLFAAMVAVVPTGISTACDARFDGLPDPDSDGYDQAYNQVAEPIKVVTRDGLQNNLVAYFGVVLVALALLLWRPHQFARNPASVTLTRLAILSYMVVVAVFAISAYNAWRGENSFAHFLSATLMFVAFGIVALHNGWRRDHVPDWYSTSCKWLLYAMVAGAIIWPVVFKLLAGVDWWVFGLEATELSLFTTFWVLQTIVFWKRDIITGREVPMPSGS
jgi:hypothetical protein